MKYLIYRNFGFIRHYSKKMSTTMSHVVPRAFNKLTFRRDGKNIFRGKLPLYFIVLMNTKRLK